MFDAESLLILLYIHCNTDFFGAYTLTILSAKPADKIGMCG